MDWVGTVVESLSLRVLSTIPGSAIMIDRSCDPKLDRLVNLSVR